MNETGVSGNYPFDKRSDSAEGPDGQAGAPACGQLEITEEIADIGAEIVFRWEAKYGGSVLSETASADLVRAILQACGSRAGLVVRQEPGRWTELLEKIPQSELSYIPSL